VGSVACSTHYTTVLNLSAHLCKTVQLSKADCPIETCPCCSIIATRAVPCYFCDQHQDVSHRCRERAALALALRPLADEGRELDRQEHQEDRESEIKGCAPAFAPDLFATPVRALMPRPLFAIALHAQIAKKSEGPKYNPPSWLDANTFLLDRNAFPSARDRPPSTTA
jgi:hypothetical protein